jgi:hypothetical protein
MESTIPLCVPEKIQEDEAMDLEDQSLKKQEVKLLKISA